MKEDTDLIPDKLNEKPTVWLGLTLGELLRLGLWAFFTSILFLAIPFGLVMGSMYGFFIGVFVAIIATGASVFVGGRMLSTKKAGKPYGYSDQKAAVFRAKLGLSRIPCITKSQIFTHKKY